MFTIIFIKYYWTFEKVPHKNFICTSNHKIATREPLTSAYPQTKIIRLTTPSLLWLVGASGLIWHHQLFNQLCGSFTFKRVFPWMLIFVRIQEERWTFKNVFREITNSQNTFKKTNKINFCHCCWWGEGHTETQPNVSLLLPIKSRKLDVLERVCWFYRGPSRSERRCRWCLGSRRAWRSGPSAQGWPGWAEWAGTSPNGDPRAMACPGAHNLATQTRNKKGWKRKRKAGGTVEKARREVQGNSLRRWIRREWINIVHPELDRYDSNK